MNETGTMESIFRLMSSLKSYLNQCLDAQQLEVAPMHVWVLMIIHKHKGCTANEIAQILKRDKAQITRLLTGLIGQGIVRKEPNPCDKRSSLLVFTQEGERLHNQLLQQAELISKSISADLTQQEIDQFEAIAAKMTQNLEKHA